MTRFPFKCSTTTKDRKYTIRDVHTTLNLANRAGLQLEIAKIENCDLTAGKKCDFAVVCESKGTVYLIEMKSKTDVLKAVEQLEETLKQSSIKEIILELKRFCWIVSLPVTPRIMRHIQNDTNHFWVTYRARLGHKESGSELAI